MADVRIQLRQRLSLMRMIFSFLSFSLSLDDDDDDSIFPTFSYLTKLLNASGPFIWWVVNVTGYKQLIAGRYFSSYIDGGGFGRENVFLTGRFGIIQDRIPPACMSTERYWSPTVLSVYRLVLYIRIETGLLGRHRKKISTDKSPMENTIEFDTFVQCVVSCFYFDSCSR